MDVQLLAFIPNLLIITFSIVHSLTPELPVKGKERLKVLTRFPKKNEVILEFFNEEGSLGVLNITKGKEPFPNYFTYNEPSILQVMMIPSVWRVKTYLCMELSNDIKDVKHALRELTELSRDKVVESDSEPWEYLALVNAVEDFFCTDNHGLYTEVTKENLLNTKLRTTILVDGLLE